MNFTYTIFSCNEEERWLFISSNDDDLNETDSFVFLLKAIAERINGKICSMGDFSYKIDNDPLQLVYQWDSLFGITVVYPRNVSEKQAKAFFENLPWFH